jgi:hypothetical protein
MLDKIEAEGEVGRPPGLERRLDLVRELVLGMQDKLDCLPLPCSNAAITSAIASLSSA